MIINITNHAAKPLTLGKRGNKIDCLKSYLKENRLKSAEISGILSDSGMSQNVSCCCNLSIISLNMYTYGLCNEFFEHFYILNIAIQYLNYMDERYLIKLEHCFEERRNLYHLRLII